MYEAIVKNTVEILCQLPVPFPESRLLAGIVKEYRAPQQEMFMNHQKLWKPKSSVNYYHP